MRSYNPIPFGDSPSVGTLERAVDSALRSRINATRVVCVLLMMYVHVPSGVSGVNAPELLGGTRLDHWLELLIVEGPGRASSALLSIVSGYLIALTLVKMQGQYRDGALLNLYKRRSKSIILPMVIWAVITCAVYLILGASQETFISAADSVLDKLNLIFFLTDTPYGPTMHLGFLRDLFMCVLLSPLLLVVLRLAPSVFIAFLAVAYLALHSIDVYIILRPLVILGFTIGMSLAISGAPMSALDRYWPLFISLMVGFACLIIFTHAGLFSSLESSLAVLNISLLESILYPLSRLFGSLGIWCMLPMLLSSRASRWVDAFTPYIFAAFCSHVLVLSILFHGLWSPLLGGPESYFHIVWFVSGPFVAMAAAMIIVKLAGSAHPQLATVLTGGRVKGKTSPSKVTQPAEIVAAHTAQSTPAQKVKREKDQPEGIT